MTDPAPISRFMERHFVHFNAATVVDAAKGWRTLLDDGGQMMLTLAGAMSTAELGKSLAELIRSDRVHAITCTGANLEEDLFNLVAHDHYQRIPNYKDLSPIDEENLLKRGLNRVTDTCIPEDQAMVVLEDLMMAHWKQASETGEAKLPHQFCYDLIRSGKLDPHHQIDPKDSWLLAACEKDLPLFVPGWEDSTLGNMFAARCVKGELRPNAVRGGIETMLELIRWYEDQCTKTDIGFFQIGGGIAGDFPICVVPLIRQDLLRKVPMWSYFCQISDSTTSYGSYSGAVPNEKISWEKLRPGTPSFSIESDATIVAPLIFAYVLGW